jgi:hypothetical protein
MAQLPVWFPADQVFKYSGSWYFGSAECVNIGPYNDRKSAARKSDEAVRALKNLGRVEQLQYARNILRDEWRRIEHGTYVCHRANGVDITAPTTRVRKGEGSRHWFRSDRFLCVSDVWFFATREGINVGPFYSRDEAERNLKQLIALLQNATEEEAPPIINEFKHRLRH